MLEPFEAAASVFALNVAVFPDIVSTLTLHLMASRVAC